MKVWWIPQVGRVNEPFEVEVPTVKIGVKILNMLAAYDLYQLEKRIKPYFANAGGLMQWDENNGDGVPGWVDWYDEETGCDNPEEWLEHQRTCPKCGENYYAQGCNECPRCGHEWNEGINQ